MLYQWPKTFHKLCHDLLGSMIHQAYQDVTKMARIVIGLDNNNNIQLTLLQCVPETDKKQKKAPEKAQIYYKLLVRECLLCNSKIELQRH